MPFLELLFRAVLALFAVAVIITFASGLVVVSLVVFLPLLLLFAAIGYFYLRHSFQKGEIGQAIENIFPAQPGLVVFRRGLGKGASLVQTRLRMKCEALTPIEAGATVVIEEVKAGKIIVIKLED